MAFSKQTRKLQFILLLKLLLFMVLLYATPSIAETPDAQESSRTLTLATRLDLPPYVMNNATEGIEIDTVKAIFDKVGVSIKFIQMPRVRMIQLFDDGKMDGILTQNASASDKGCLTDWYLSHQNFGFSLKNRGIKLHSLADLKDYSVLSFDGARKYLGSHFARAVENNPHYTEAADQSVHIELLYKKRFDLIVGEEWIMRLVQMRTYLRTGEYHSIESHNILPVSLYSARFHSSEICKLFDKGLQETRQNGSYQSIAESYKSQIINQLANAELNR